MGIASWWAWWPTGEERLKRRRGEVRRAVEDEESDVEDALALAKRAAESTEHLDAAKNEAESALSDLKELGDRVECADGDTLDWIEEEVKALDLRRAYILPAKALPIEATARESEAQDWGLPSQGLGRLKSRGDQVRQLPESETQRMWFWWFLDEYHYWDGYLDWYEGLIDWASWVLTAACFLALVSALLVGLWLRSLVIAFALAGVSGAALSVLLNQPAVGVYADFTGAWRAMIGRFVTGVVAAVVGLGVLASGIIVVGVPQHGSRFVSPAMLVRGCTGNGSAGSNCTSADILVLLAIGVLFGFTERALTAFQRAIIGSRRRTPGREGRAGRKTRPRRT